MTLPDRLGHYRVLEKLGAGGMGEVYVAEDTKLGRRVALKILPAATARDPDRLARFQREAKTVASLNHPNIVTLHSVEEVEGIHFLTMELVDGEPLTARLRREGLPLADILQLALPLIEAVDAAHGRGITHRDLKPDNVMVTLDGRVKVLDFGLAKPGGSGLGNSETSETSVDVNTHEGQILGTVAYMSPEQAEARAVDHRSDIFSMGILLYEMSSGFQPFRGASKISILSSILRDTPQPISEIRRDLPADMGRIVQRCLEKDPQRRYQSARDVYNDLDALRADGTSSLSPASGWTRGSGIANAGSDDASASEGGAVRRPEFGSGAAASGPEESGPGARIRRAHLARMTLLFLFSSAVALFVVRSLVYRMGLPDWVLPGAFLLLALGLPIVLTTAWIQSSLRDDGQVRSRRRWFTWRRAIGGGVAAFAFLGLLVTAYAITRELGIGPAASLVSSGVLSERDHVLVADFENDTTDETLGETVKEALTIDLSQSPTVQVVPAQRVGEVLRLMDRDPRAHLDGELAREVAERDGIKAVVEGRIHTAGAGYVLTARLLSSSTGEVLGAYRVSAGGPGELIAAIDELSKSIRTGIGESLKSIRANPPLHRVTTQSLEALRKYSMAVRKSDVEGDQGRALELLREATDLDSTFAMASRKLGTILSNSFRQNAVARQAFLRAYRHRHRLPDRERLLTEASYFMSVTDQPELAIGAYEQLIELDPRDDWAHNNLGVVYSKAGEREKALEYYGRANEISPNALKLGNIIGEQVSLGRDAAAESTLSEFARLYPDNPGIFSERSLFAASRFRYDEAAEHAQALREETRGSVFSQAGATGMLAAIRQTQGRLREAEALYAESRDFDIASGNRAAGLEFAMTLAAADVFVRAQPEAAVRRLDRALEEQPLDSLVVEDRPYVYLASLYAAAGRADVGRQLLERFDETLDGAPAETERMERAMGEGVVAFVQGRAADAVATLQTVVEESPAFPEMYLAILGMAQEAAGDPVSARESYERYLAGRTVFRLFIDRDLLGEVLGRLAGVYAAAGDRDRALATYQRLTELWAGADPDVQLRVERVRREIHRLAGEPGL